MHMHHAFRFGEKYKQNKAQAKKKEKTEKNK